jgi:3-phenylpropionate/cinnamic acid dioxygenase small subunit
MGQLFNARIQSGLKHNFEVLKMNKTVVKEALDTGVVIEAVQSMTGAESIAPDHMGRGRLPASGYIPTAQKVDWALQQDVEHLLFKQAALLDAKSWQGFIDLFSDDGVYWMPSNASQTDWSREASIFAEDKLLMEVRMGRVQHPNAWSQAALWETNHIVGNVCIESITDEKMEVFSKFQMMELRRDNVRHFAGTYRHSLIKSSSGWQIKLQRVDLTNAQGAFDYVIQAWV